MKRPSNRGKIQEITWRRSFDNIVLKYVKKSITTEEMTTLQMKENETPDPGGGRMTRKVCVSVQWRCLISKLIVLNTKIVGIVEGYKINLLMDIQVCA